jgi:hypothetical protein
MSLLFFKGTTNGFYVRLRMLVHVEKGNVCCLNLQWNQQLYMPHSLAIVSFKQLHYGGFKEAETVSIKRDNEKNCKVEILMVVDS